MQNFIALDLEFNQPSQTIIQVGIAWTFEGKILQKSWNIKTSEELDPHVARLCNLTQEDLQKGITLEAAISQFPDLESFHDEPIVYGKGDLEKLQQALEHPYWPWLKGSIDVSNVVKFQAMGRGINNVRFSLKSALQKMYGIPFEGQKHNAGWDAYNTLKLWLTMLEREKHLDSALKSISKNVLGIRTM